MMTVPEAKAASFESRCTELDVYFLVKQTEDFIVFLDQELDVDWLSSDNYDQHTRSSLGFLGRIENRVTELSAYPFLFLDIEQRRAFRCMVAAGMARALEGKEEEADQILDLADRFYSTRSKEIARQWYVLGSSVAFIAIAFVGLWIWALRDHCASLLGTGASPLALGAVAGALGALCSVLLRASGATVDAVAGARVHYGEGAFRVIAGCSGAIIVALAVDGGFLLANLRMSLNDGDSLSRLLAICAVCGASERLVPSLIQQVEVKLLPPVRRGRKE